MGNPTEELRAKLNELGVEWETGEDSHGNEEIWWRSPVFDAWVCVTLGEELGTVQLEHPMDITPEQAIAATVGTGTCKAIDTGYATAKCSECGAEFMGSIMTNEPPDYVKPLERCPSCGRRIKEDGE